MGSEDSRSTIFSRAQVLKQLEFPNIPPIPHDELITPICSSQSSVWQREAESEVGTQDTSYSELSLLSTSMSLISLIKP